MRCSRNRKRFIVTGVENSRKYGWGGELLMEVISFQFMQGLVNQFKEFELYFNNNQELLKAFS